MKKLIVLFLFLLLLTGCSKTHNVTITYEPNGGLVFPATSTVNSNSPQWVPSTPQKDSYFFVNWYVDQDLTELYLPSHLLDNDELTLYAEYIEVDQTDFYIVSFSTVGGTYIPNQLVTSGGLLEVPTTPTKDGYTFSTWVYAVTLNNLSGPVNFSTPITEHMTLEAEYSSSSTDSKR